MAELKRLNEAALAEKAEELGLEIDTSAMSKAELIRAIQNAQQPHEEKVEDLENEAPAPAKKRGPKQYKIIVHHQDGIENTPFIKVGVNGVMYQITREKEVIVNEYVKHALDNATMTIFRQDGRVMIPQEVRRFPYSVLEVL